MKTPFNITTSQDCDDLILLSDGRYQLVSGGDTAPLMIGYQYVVADLEFLSHLESVNAEGFTPEPTSIFRRSTGEELSDYVRLRIHRGFTDSDLKDIDLEGDRLILMNQEHLFATPTLCEKLKAEKISYIRLSPGLSQFAG